MELPQENPLIAGGEEKQMDILGRGEVELDRVSFGFDPDRRALDRVSLRVPAGSRLAVVGGAGAGKSTLAAIVARLYDPDSGRVLIDGRDARECSVAWLRSQIALVPGPPARLAGSVAANIADGTGASREAVVAAAKAAGAHAFVSELPEHYDTVLGAGGVELSAGQRQRIAIARAVLRDPSVLVLDEPTIGLDAESEARVADGLFVLMHGRTTILITRSPALARSADHMLVMEAGRVERQGSPEALLDRARVTRSFITEQSRVGPGVSAVPEDPALPALGRLLDSRAMAPLLKRSLAPPSPVPDVRIKNVRYKPGASVVVHYNVGLDGKWYDAVARVCPAASIASRAARARNRALAAKVHGRSPALHPLRYEPELDALVQWLPLDLSLPALAERPRELALALRREGLDVPAEEPALLSYRPRRRAVLRLGGHVLKAYFSDEYFGRAKVGLLASANLRAVPTPAFEAALPGLRLTAQTMLGGSPPPHDPGTVRRTAELVRELHRSRVEGLPLVSPRAQLHVTAAAAGLAAALVPGLRPRLERLVARLESTLPETAQPVPSHGDFHARQVMGGERGLALIDFDVMCAAPAAFDLAHYAAHLVRGSEGDDELAQVVLAQLVEGYDERPAWLDWYLASSVLRRAPFPFRYLDDDWPGRVRAMVATAEALQAG